MTEVYPFKRVYPEIQSKPYSAYGMVRDFLEIWGFIFF